MGEDRREGADRSTDASIERLTITEAAQRLGVSRDAVYKRIRRGSIASETGVDGLLYVYIEPSIDESTEASTDVSGAPNEHLERLLTAQERELEYLRSQLDAEREARRRADHIIAALTERIPELEAPPQSAQEAESVAESASEGAGREEAGERQEERTETESAPAERRSWWRRIFGG